MAAYRNPLTGKHKEMETIILQTHFPCFRDTTQIEDSLT